MEAAIDIQNLVKRYGKVRGVEDISLLVNKGDFFGFIGPNGAGKSTTIRAMLGLIYKDAGKIRVLGMDAEKERVAMLRKIGYMPSETMFYPNRKVSEIIKMTEAAYGIDCVERAKYLCEQLEVDVNKRIDQLSLGNRKKVSIVSTMQHEPELYILDEPTSGLDPLMQKEFFRLLSEENKKGATIFFSSHVLGEIQNYCNKAAIIKDGKVIASDTVANLLNTKAKKVTLRGCDQVPQIQGVSQVIHDTDLVHFLYHGEAKELIQSLSALSLQDVLIEEPSLEEIVLHFYEKGEK